MTLRLMQELAQPGRGTSERADGPSPTLTRRELDVLRAVADGKSNQEIGKDLFLSENTVKYHVHSILDKLQLKSRREAATYAKDRGLIKKD